MDCETCHGKLSPIDDDCRIGQVHVVTEATSSPWSNVHLMGFIVSSINKCSGWALASAAFLSAVLDEETISDGPAWSLHVVYNPCPYRSKSIILDVHTRADVGKIPWCGWRTAKRLSRSMIVVRSSMELKQRSAQQSLGDYKIQVLSSTHPSPPRAALNCSQLRLTSLLESCSIGRSSTSSQSTSPMTHRSVTRRRRSLVNSTNES
nr:hypothetical protein CFP56_70965 [Quercus suber]